jgi:hypothetical protein
VLAGEAIVPASATPDEIRRAVADMMGSDRGVLLTTIRACLKLESTRAVRELLDRAGITVRPSVRTAKGNGPGVHRYDVIDSYLVAAP